LQKTFWGNMSAYRHLENYLKQKHPSPLILTGKQGLGKQMAALTLASALLNCPEEELVRNRDFLLIDKGKEPIKVEDILGLLEQSSFTSLGTRKVYLICHAEKMNIQAQNKLLKLLEDRNLRNIVLLVCEQDTLPDTIKSRCVTITFSLYLTVRWKSIWSIVKLKMIILLSAICVITVLTVLKKH